MLCSRFLKRPKRRPAHAPGELPAPGHEADSHATEPLGGFGAATERYFQAMLNGYDRTLQIAMRHRPLTMAAAAVVLILTAVLFVVVPKGFIPDQDTGQIAVTTEAAQGTSYDKLVQYQDQVSNIIRQDANVAALVSTIGGNAASTLGGPNLGQIVVTLKPRGERPLLVQDVIDNLRPKLAQVPGMQVFMQNPPTIRIGGQVSKSPYQYSIQAADKQQLYATTKDLMKRLAEVPGIQDLTSDLEITSPQINVEIDRDKAAALGVNASQIENAFYDAYGPRWVTTIYAAVNEYKVLLELAPQFQADPSALSMLYFKGNGSLVPLDTLASIKQQVGPQTVNHYGQLTSATISFGLQRNAALGNVLSHVNEIATAALPDGVTGQFQGAAKAFEGALSNLAVLLLIAVLVVYIVLGILYESYIHPLTILSGLPSAAFGALVTLLVFGMDLNIYAFVGMIMLIGIVEKNAIMQIDFALDAERRGLSSEQAIYQGCLTRFRPIMMTTMAALLGAVPIAVGYGAGGESRRPLGMVVVGGLLFSQLVTLYLTPVFFTYMAQLQRWIQGRRVSVPASAVPATAE
jgi:HAE1 family hydrophobic/amphiphilic exporter-1